MTENPYAAPRAAVADVVESRDDGNFLGEGRAVPAGHGWQWIVSAWTLFKQAPLLWFVFVLIMVGASFALGFVPILGPLAQNLVTPFIMAAMALFADGIRAGRGADLGAAFTALPAHARSLAVLGVIYLVGIVAVMFLSFVPFFGLRGLGFFTGAAPMVTDGSIGLAVLVYFVLAVPFFMATAFAPVLVVLHDKAPLEALPLSFFACLRNILPFIVFLLAVMGLSIVALLPLGLGFFVLVPVLMASGYATYRDVFFDE